MLHDHERVKLYKKIRRKIAQNVQKLLLERFVP